LNTILGEALGNNEDAENSVEKEAKKP